MLSRAGANRLCMKGFIQNGRKRVNNITVVLQESKIKPGRLHVLSKFLYLASSQLHPRSFFSKIHVKCILDAKHITTC